MKHITDMDDIPTNFYTRTSRNKYEEVNITPLSKIGDYQTSMSAFSTRIESKNVLKSNNIGSKKSKKDKKVEFNPLISVINIESFKNENYEGTFGQQEPDNSHSEFFKKENERKCMVCTIF